MSGALCALAGAGGGDTFISLSNATVSSAGASTRTATYRLGSDGKVYHGVNGSFALSETWCNAPGDPPDYEAKVTVTDGSLSSGSTGSWLALTANRDWAVQDSVSGDGEPVEATMTVEIRNAVTTVVVKSATVTVSANRTS